MTTTKELPEMEAYIRAGYPVLYLHTFEEMRAEEDLLAFAKQRKFKVWVWSCVDGLHRSDNDPTGENKIPGAALDAMLKDDGAEPTLWIFRDLHPFFQMPDVVRRVRNAARKLKTIPHTMIIISPVRNIPPELERDITVMDFELPDKTEVDKIFSDIFNGHETKLKKYIDDDERERIIDGALGLTTIEAENCFAKAIVQHDFARDSGVPISRRVLREKAQAVKKSGVLEFHEPNESAKDIGGLEYLKAWFESRRNAFTKSAKEYGLPSPKGAMLIGPPGCGKSLSAKVVSNMLGLPLLRLDIGRVLGSLVGQSEASMDSVLRTIDAIGACVVFVDELEKSLGGMASGSLDSGVGQRVFGKLLTWMQDHTSPAFVIATVNKIATIQESAPELLRKGRFDEIFFVDLPSDSERLEILKIHLKKKGRDPDKFDLGDCVDASDGFSGAELEQAIISAMFNAFGDGEREVIADDIWLAIKSTVPLSKSAAGTLAEMRQWAEKNATHASKAKSKKSGKGRRRLDV